MRSASAETRQKKKAHEIPRTARSCVRGLTWLTIGRYVILEISVLVWTPLEGTPPTLGFGAMDVTKPYEFIGFGAMDVTKPYKSFMFVVRFLWVALLVA